MAQALVVDDALRAVSLGAHRALIMISVTGAVFAIGLALTVQVFRANAALVKRRADFVSSVTHELKTPVATIRAAGETLMSGRVTGPDTSREYARLVVEQAKRLTRLLNNLLAYARITDTTEGYAFEPVNLETLAHESLRDWRWQLESGGFTVDIDVPPDVPSVRVDRTAFGLLLDNLVANAIGHSTHTRSIRISARRAPREVILDVADRGVGIPPDELALVTRKFFRGRGSIPGGSGLGLAIAERIVADHSGSLTIQSAVGAGTTVRVTLPIEEAHSE
jgi:signal transduction histidine kinase